MVLTDFSKEWPMSRFLSLRALRRVALTGVVMSLMLSSTTFASSLPLLAPSALKGHWQLNDAEGKAPACNVELSDELIEGTNAYRFTAEEQCLQPLSLTELPVAWRPTPDGMTLTNADGSMVAFLALTAPKRYEVMNHNGKPRFSLTPRQ
ncbi:Proteinase inhibitor precursor [compost metagenome]